MRRKPFLIFLAVVSLIVVGIVWFIQSTQFAQVVKKVAARYVPGDVGIDGDFSELAVKLFPPGISIRNPKIILRQHNVVNLPPGSEVSAERIDLEFLPFQMFSGKIRVHQVVIVNGDVRLKFGANGSGAKNKRSGFHWDELLQIHADAVAARNTRISIESSNPVFSVQFVADSLRLGQVSGKSGPGYDLAFDLSSIESSVLKGIPVLAGSADELRAVIRASASGLEVFSLSLSKNGIEATASGNISGDMLLKPTSLAANLEVALSGELGGVLGHEFGAVGHVSFAGKAKADLLRLADTLRVDGALAIKDAGFRAWKADLVSMEGAFASSSRGGEVVVTRAVVTTAEKNRVGGRQPGEGGRIEIGAFRFPVGSQAALDVPVNLQRVHIHWLAAPALKNIYPLDFRASGPLRLAYSPASGSEPWKVRANLGLAIEKFQLDNQRLGQTKPLRKVLVIPLIKLEGDAEIAPEGLNLSGVTLGLGRTRIRATGKVGAQSGYDLHAVGQVNLEDFGELAENEIKGDGSINARIHGPSSRVIVDFDADLREAFYLKLQLGDLKGRITLDETPEDLIFSGVNVTRGSTHYSVDGKIELLTDTIALKVPVRKGNVRDLTRVFEKQLKDLWWFPEALNGNVSGNINVTGGLGMDRLEVAGNLVGKDWEYYGERFHAVNLAGGFDRGRYHIDEARASKRGGILVGRISYADDGELDWDFRTRDLSVSDIDFVARLDVPLRGKLQVSSAGRGKHGAIRSDNRSTLTDFSVRGVGMAPSHLALTSQGGFVAVDGSGFGGQGKIDVGYDFKPKGKSSIKAEFNRLDFSPLLLLLNPKTIQDRLLSGTVTGSVDLSFNSGEAERASGNISITEYVIAKSGTAFQLSRPVSIPISDGTFDIADLALRGKKGEASLKLAGRRGSISGSVTGALDVSLVEFLSSSVVSASGDARLGFSMGGTIKEPLIQGKADLEAVTVRVQSVESPFENVTGAFALRQNTVYVENVSGDLAGGRVSFDGTVLLHADSYPELSLKGLLSGPKIKVYPFQYVLTRGWVGVTGSRVPYLVEGALTVDSALSKEKVLGQKQPFALKALQYTPSPSREREGDYPKFKLKVDVVAERGIIVQNDLFDAELKGHVTIVNTLETPRIVGSAELIHGEMLFKDRKFTIQSAGANFDSTTTINPLFNMTARTDVNGTKIQLFASGRMSSWKVDLTSNPVLPESEIISLLAMGMTSRDARRFSSTDRSLYEQGEAAALLLHSLDFNREVENKTGIQIQLDESVNSQVGTSVFRPQSQAEAVASPKIVIRKQVEIFKKPVDVSYGSTLGSGSSGGKTEVNAELHLKPGLSVIGVWDNLGSADTQDRSSSIGMDLKWQTRFK